MLPISSSHPTSYYILVPITSHSSLLSLILSNMLLTCMMTSHPTLLPFILYHLISFCPASVYPILLLLILYLSLYIITYYPVLFLCFLNISCLFIKILIDHNFFVKIFAHRFLCKNIVLTHEFNITDWLLCALISFITLFIVWQHGGGRCWPLQRGHRQSFTVQRAQPWSTPVDGQLPFQHWENWGTTGQLRSELPRVPSLSHWFTAAFWAVGHYAVIISVGGEQLRKLSHVFLRRHR